jgi:hypothetical protein
MKMKQKTIFLLCIFFVIFSFTACTNQAKAKKGVAEQSSKVPKQTATKTAEKNADKETETETAKASTSTKNTLLSSETTKTEAVSSENVAAKPNETIAVPEKQGVVAGEQGFSIQQNVFDLFQLPYQKIIERYGNINSAYYWEGGLCVSLEKGIGDYFFDYSPDFEYDRFLDTKDLKDTIPASDSSIHRLHTKVKELIQNCPATMNLNDMIALFQPQNLSYAYDEAGYYGEDYIIWFDYGSFSMLIACDKQGFVKSENCVEISLGKQDSSNEAQQ